MHRQIPQMVVVVTGASSGIGRALAVALARRGAKLVLAARRMDRLQSLAAELGDGHLAVQTDVSVPEQCRRLIDRAAEHFGRIDTLVCNAGYGLCRPMVQTTHEEFDAIMRTNVYGTTDCVRCAVPIMLRQEQRQGWRGQVMIVSSVIGRRGMPCYGAYAATKSAQIGLAEALRVELRPQAIAVTLVLPAGTETEFFSTAERLGGMRMLETAAMPAHQAADTVARKMLRSIERPRPEVWPKGSMRFLMPVSNFMSGTTDKVVGRCRVADGSAK